MFDRPRCVRQRRDQLDESRVWFDRRELRRRRDHQHDMKDSIDVGRIGDTNGSDDG